MINETELAVINDLVSRRKMEMDKLHKTMTNLGITLQGTYQADELLDVIRPHIAEFFIRRIKDIDQQLREAGFTPEPIPGQGT